MSDSREQRSDSDPEEKKPVSKTFTAYDVQRYRLEKLMENPDKPVSIPVRQEKGRQREAPDFVRNVMGSSAGAGSGEFHVYRHLRRKEFARQRVIEEEARREELDLEYQERLERNRREAEERVERNRLKRLKKKQKMKQKGKKQKSVERESEEDEDSEDSAHDSDSQKKGTDALGDDKEKRTDARGDKEKGTDARGDDKEKETESAKE